MSLSVEHQQSYDESSMLPLECIGISQNYNITIFRRMLLIEYVSPNHNYVLIFLTAKIPKSYDEYCL